MSDTEPEPGSIILSGGKFFLVVALIPADHEHPNGFVMAAPIQRIGLQQIEYVVKDDGDD